MLNLCDVDAISGVFKYQFNEDTEYEVICLL